MTMTERVDQLEAETEQILVLTSDGCTWVYNPGNEPAFEIDFADALDLHTREWATHTRGRHSHTVHHIAIVCSSRRGISSEWEFDGRFGRGTDIIEHILAWHRDYYNRLNSRFLSKNQ